MAKIICDRCKKDITSLDDLIVTYPTKYFIGPANFETYHNECFTIVKKTDLNKKLSYRTPPVNSKKFTYNAILYFSIFIIAFTMLFFLSFPESQNFNNLKLDRFTILIAVLFITFFLKNLQRFIYRIQSYYRFEKPLGVKDLLSTLV